MFKKSDIESKLKFALGGTFNILAMGYVFNYIFESQKRKGNKIIEPILLEENKEKSVTTASNAPATENSHSHIFRNMFNAMLAGSSVAYTTFPLEARKKWKQSGQVEKFHWFRGANVFAANIVPTTTIHFLTDRFLKEFLPINATITQNIAASILCGITGATTATFVENTIMRQQVMKNGPIGAIKDMLNINFYRPWKTFSYIAARDGIFTFSMFWAMPEASKWCKQNAPNYELVTPFAISFLGASLSHPIDTIATRLQMSHLKESGLKNAKALIKEAGYKGLFKGFSYRFGLFTIFSNGLPFINQLVDKAVGNKIFADNNNSPRPGSK